MANESQNGLHTVEKVEVKVTSFGTELVIPKGMTHDQAITAIRRQKEFEQTEVSFTEEIKGYFILDCAYAFYRAMLQMFGAVTQRGTFSFFTGPRPPEKIQVQISETEKVQIPWGLINLPTLENGTAQTDMGMDSNGAFFVLRVTVKQKYASIVKDLFTQTRQILAESSIYAGKALEIKFRSESDGELLRFPEVKFMRMSKIHEDDIILNEGVKTQVFTDLITPIRHAEACKRVGVPIKRGVLLAGPYGTGKSMTAQLAARIAVENGFTFIYVRNPNEFFEAYQITQFYSPAVVFCEDIDLLLDGERDEEMNRIINILDGVDTKNRNTITVLTTNRISKIHASVLRPGRLDGVITFEAPNAESIEKLIRMYGKGLIKAGEDLTEVGKVLEGSIPAIVREAVEKAKLYQIYLSKGDISKLEITSEALLNSAKQLRGQIGILQNALEDKRPKQVKTICEITETPTNPDTIGKQETWEVVSKSN